MGVKPLGPGPGTQALVMQRQSRSFAASFDRKLAREIVIPPNSRKVIVSTVFTRARNHEWSSAWQQRWPPSDGCDRSGRTRDVH